MIPEKEIARGPILVVDDSEGIRSYLSTLLRGWGYQVELVASGEAALEFIEENGSPGLVLLDLMLPGMGGLETLERIRKVDEMLPVVIISVVSRAAIIVEAMRTGAADFINKPFEEIELQGAVSSLLPLVRASKSVCSGRGSFRSVHLGERVDERNSSCHQADLRYRCDCSGTG